MLILLPLYKSYNSYKASVAMSQGQLSALIRLTQQPLYIVQMLPTSFLP
jgi:hypothetical protein